MSSLDEKVLKEISRRKFLAGVALAGASLPIAGIASGTDTHASMHKRKICIFSKHLQWLDYDGMAQTAAEIGFDGIDLTVRPKGHVLPERVEQDLPAAVEAVEKAGLKVDMMTTRITDPDDVNTETILKTASQLGIKYYRMGYLRYDNSLGITESLELFKPKIAKLAELNKKYNIHGAYQNHAGVRVGGPVWDIWELIKDLDPQWFGCQYDIRHAVLEGGSSWPLGLQLLSDYIKITAIKDFKWTKIDGEWKSPMVPLGEGMVDFDRYFKMIKEIKIPGPISLHFEYPLGGADKGSRELSIDRDKIIAIMRKDLNMLRGWLEKYAI